MRALLPGQGSEGGRRKGTRGNREVKQNRERGGGEKIKRKSAALGCAARTSLLVGTSLACDTGAIMWHGGRTLARKRCQHQQKSFAEEYSKANHRRRPLGESGSCKHT